MKNIVDLIGRIFLSVIFFYEAFDTLFYFEETKETLSRLGIVWQQDFQLYVAIAVLSLGATLVLTGYRTGLGVIMLLIYWVPATFMVYDFWNLPKPESRMAGFMFMKNLAIMGGLFLLWVNGSQRFSIRKILATTKVR